LVQLLKTLLKDEGFEIFMAVTMKNAVFWYVALCGFIIHQRFGGTYCLHLHGRRNNSNEEVSDVPPKCRFIINPHGVTSQKTAFFKADRFCWKVTCGSDNLHGVSSGECRQCHKMVTSCFTNSSSTSIEQCAGALPCSISHFLLRQSSKCLQQNELRTTVKDLFIAVLVYSCFFWDEFHVKNFRSVRSDYDNGCSASSGGDKMASEI
jgi:hypothetical protein